MKLVTAAVATASAVLFGISMASANPAASKHDGYPMKNSGSPVTGQPTANDPGQSMHTEPLTAEIRRLSQNANRN